MSTRRWPSIRPNPGAVGSRSFECYARLRPGVALTEARAELDAVARQLARELPLDRGYGVFVSGLQDYLVREGRPALRLLMAVVAVVLLLACVNVAGLLTVRGAARRQELAVRASLGASKGRLVRQLVIESLVLAALAAVIGLVLARWSTRALVALTEGALSVGTTRPVELDATCLAFTLVISTLTALAFGLIPALQAGSAEPQAILGRQSRGGTADRAQQRAERRARRRRGGARRRADRRSGPPPADVQQPCQRRSRLPAGADDYDAPVPRRSRRGLSGAPRGRDPPARRRRPRRRGRRNHPVPSACGHDLRIGFLACRPADCRSPRPDDGVLAGEPRLFRRDWHSGVAGPRVRCRRHGIGWTGGNRQPRVRPTLLSRRPGSRSSHPCACGRSTAVGDRRCRRRHPARRPDDRAGTDRVPAARAEPRVHHDPGGPDGRRAREPRRIDQGGNPGRGSRRRPCRT